MAFVAAAVRRRSRPDHSFRTTCQSLHLVRCSSSSSTSPSSSSTSPSSSASPPRFTYAVAASYSAKNLPPRPKKFVFNFNAHNRIVAKRENKRSRPQSGQDAFFASRIGESAGVALGVVDGVGGWTASGIDPADFAHGLCDYMAYAAYTHGLKAGDGDAMRQEAPLTARSLIQRGFDQVCEDDDVNGGGSTACVGLATEDGALEIANLGDSGFVLLRGGAVQAQSQPQTHDFNTPYQLSKQPAWMQRQMLLFGGGRLMDYPDDADVSHHQLRHGDVLLFATDGVFDNVSISEILEETSRVMFQSRAWTHVEQGIRVSPSLPMMVSEEGIKGDMTFGYRRPIHTALAATLACFAKGKSKNLRIDGPFAKQMQQHFPHEKWRGGKVDDICVLVAIALEVGK